MTPKPKLPATLPRTAREQWALYWRMRRAGYSLAPHRLKMWIEYAITYRDQPDQLTRWPHVQVWRYNPKRLP